MLRFICNRYIINVLTDIKYFKLNNFNKHISLFMNKQLEPLLLRLTNAERKAKAIELEVQCIRKEITRLITTAKRFFYY